MDDPLSDSLTRIPLYDEDNLFDPFAQSLNPLSFVPSLPNQPLSTNQSPNNQATNQCDQSNKRRRDPEEPNQRKSRLEKQQKIDRDRRARESQLFEEIQQLLDYDKASSRVQILERVVEHLKQSKQTANTASAQSNNQSNSHPTAQSSNQSNNQPIHQIINHTDLPTNNAPCHTAGVQSTLVHATNRSHNQPISLHRPTTNNQSHLPTSFNQSPRSIHHSASFSHPTTGLNNPHTPVNQVNSFLDNLVRQTQRFMIDLNSSYSQHQSNDADSPYLSIEINRFLYSSFFFTHRSILFLIDVTNGKLLDANDQFRSRLGLTQVDLSNDRASLHPCLSTTPLKSLCSSLSVCSSTSRVACSDHNIVNHHITDQSQNNFTTFIKLENEDDHCWSRLMQPLNLDELYNGSKSMMQCQFAMKNASDELIEGEMKYWLESNRSLTFLVFECWESDLKQSLTASRLHRCDC